MSRLKWTLLTLFVLLIGGQLAFGQTSSTSQSAYQSFENGFMIWRGDTGTIYVLLNNGTYLTFPEASYRNLPDNPVTDTPPAGRVKPIRGFGRVWGNNPNVRAMAGWATSGEVAYMLTVSPAEEYPTRTRTLNTPDGRQIRLGTWTYTDVVQPPTVITPTYTPTPVSGLPSDTTISITLQRYEQGYMMYWQNTGSIWVLNDDGKSREYSSTSYGNFPDAPYIEPPAGRVRPLFGMGKVWYWHGVRYQLGWATTPEQGYDVFFRRYYVPGYGVTLSLRFPDGRELTLRDTNTWYFART